MAGPLRTRLGEDFFRQVPSKPGVYLMLGARRELLYVGKAKNLRTRLRSYARTADDDDERLVLLVSAIHAIEWEECATEELALGRETELLRATRPPFNFTHTASTEYLSIAIKGRGDRVRLRLTAGAAQAGERLYGCFPFAAAAPGAYAALVRLLCLAQPDARGRVPSQVTRAAGCDAVLADGLRGPLRTFLAGRSRRLPDVLEQRIAEQHGGDRVVLHGAARDLEVLGPFYELGPRALRRLQAREGVPFGPVSGDELSRLLAAAMGAQIGAKVRADREAVEDRIAALRQEQLGFGAIAERLNADGTPRLRGGGKWAVADVAEVVGELVAKATTTAALSSTNLRR